MRKVSGVFIEQLYFDCGLEAIGKSLVTNMSTRGQSQDPSHRGQLVYPAQMVVGLVAEALTLPQLDFPRQEIEKCCELIGRYDPSGRYDSVPYRERLAVDEYLPQDLLSQIDELPEPEQIVEKDPGELLESPQQFTAQLENFRAGSLLHSGKYGMSVRKGQVQEGFETAYESSRQDILLQLDQQIALWEFHEGELNRDYQVITQGKEAIILDPDLETVRQSSNPEDYSAGSRLLFSTLLEMGFEHVTLCNFVADRSKERFGNASALRLDRHQVKHFRYVPPEPDMMPIKPRKHGNPSIGRELHDFVRGQFQRKEDEDDQASPPLSVLSLMSAFLRHWSGIERPERDILDNPDNDDDGMEVDDLADDDLLFEPFRDPELDEESR